MISLSEAFEVKVYNSWIKENISHDGGSLWQFNFVLVRKHAELFPFRGAVLQINSIISILFICIEDISSGVPKNNEDGYVCFFPKYFLASICSTRITELIPLRRSFEIMVTILLRSRKSIDADATSVGG